MAGGSGSGGWPWMRDSKQRGVCTGKQTQHLCSSGETTPCTPPAAPPLPPDAAQCLNIGAGGVLLQPLSLQPLKDCRDAGRVAATSEGGGVGARICVAVVPMLQCTAAPPPLCRFAIHTPLATLHHRPQSQRPSPPTHPPLLHRSSSEAGGSAAASEARHWMARLRTPARLSSSSGSSACPYGDGVNERRVACCAAARAKSSLPRTKQTPPQHSTLPAPKLLPHLLQALWIGQDGAIACGQLRQDVQAGTDHVSRLLGGWWGGWVG